MHSGLYRALVLSIGVFVGFGLAIFVLIAGIKASLRAGKFADLLSRRHKLLARGDEAALSADEAQEIVRITEELIADSANARVLDALGTELARAKSARSACERGDWPAAQQHLSAIGRRTIRFF